MPMDTTIYGAIFQHVDELISDMDGLAKRSHSQTLEAALTALSPRYYIDNFQELIEQR